MHTKKILKCKLCEFVSTNKEDFKLHTQVEHKHVQVVISKEDMVEIKCDECEYKCHLNIQLRKHMATHVMALDIKCEICPFTTKEETEMKTHIQTLHEIVEVKPEEQNVFKCDQCEYKCKLKIQYNQHMKLKHKERGRYTCKHCEFKTNFIGSVWEHTILKHEESSTAFTPKETENIILNMVAEQTTNITEEMDHLKKDTKDVYNNLADILTTLIVKVAKIEEVLVTKNTELKVEKNIQAHKTNPGTSENETSTEDNISKMKTFASVTAASSSPHPDASKPSSNIKTSSKAKIKTKYLKKQKMLFVGDSVGHTVNLRTIEIARNCRIRSARAHSSVYD